MAAWLHGCMAAWLHGSPPAAPLPALPALKPPSYASPCCPPAWLSACSSACPPACPCLQVIAATKEGQYVLTRPAAAYKKVFTPLAEKAAICFEASMPGQYMGAVHGLIITVQHAQINVTYCLGLHPPPCTSTQLAPTGPRPARCTVPLARRCTRR